MINLDPAFRHDLLQITVGNRISDIEEHRVQNHRFGILAAFEIIRHVLILTLEFKRRRLPQVTKQAHIPKSLRQNPPERLQERRKTAKSRDLVNPTR